MNAKPSSDVAFVTGATGLLGGNLVRLLVGNGIRVRALVRSPAKADAMLAGLPVEVVVGDMTAVDGFAAALRGVGTVYHTAAFFRDNYAGGRHVDALRRTNVDGTAALIAAAHAAGVRRFVHASSIAVLDGRPGEVIHEGMARDPARADDYYLSKIDADRAIDRFLAAHPEMWAALVLPGWMHGPGDAGPTSAGQTVLDFVRGRLPGVIDATVSLVDARDVAQAMVLAAAHGRRGERYLAAGRHLAMAEVFAALERASGVRAPTRRIPGVVLRAVAAWQEAWSRLTGRPVLLSWAGVRLLAAERDRTRFDPRKSAAELGLSFRPVAETLADAVAWYRAQGLLPA